MISEVKLLVLYQKYLRRKMHDLPPEDAAALLDGLNLLLTSQPDSRLKLNAWQRVRYLYQEGLL